MKPMTFALYLGNRGVFPGEIIEAARVEMRTAIEKAGHVCLEMDPSLTRFGAVETLAEGKIFADFLKRHEGQFDGVVLCLPNFGDENGAVAALQDAGVPILLQAYPDEFGMMDYAHRRDAFCGKLSIADVFRQFGIPFTALEPHTVHPASEEFARQLDVFARTCAVVKRMRRFNVGAIGARTTAFKTIRFDEVALAQRGINCESFDLTQLFAKMADVDPAAPEFAAARARIEAMGDMSAVPEERRDDQTRLYLALKSFAAEYDLGALGLRCWNEMQDAYRIAPCTVMALLASEGLPCACELDICNAVAMAALQAAADAPPICMDWNNNYGDDPDKCILFHCGSVPAECMAEPGTVISHVMFDKGREDQGGFGWGCNQGRVKPAPMTYLSAKTECGKVAFYLGEGAMTNDPIEQAFFGAAGVAQIPGLQKVLLGICREGFRHHVSIALDHVAEALREAFSSYLGYEIVDFR